MPNFVAVDDDGNEDIQCCVCLQPWDEPTELEPCKHIFCTACIRTLVTCPDCRAPIVKRQTPNRILRNMALAVRVKCDVCSWEGSREMSQTHACASALLETLASTSSSGGTTGPRPIIHRGLDEEVAPAAQQALQPQVAQAPAPLAPAMVAAPAPPPPGPAYSVPRPGDVQRESRPWETYQLSRDEYDVIVATFLMYDNTPNAQQLAQLTRWLHHAFNDRDVDEFVWSLTTSVNTRGATSSNGPVDMYCKWLSQRRRDPAVLYNTSHAAYRAILTRFRSYDVRTEGKLSNEACLQLLLDEKLAADPQAADELLEKMETDGGRRARRDFIEFDDLMNLFFVGYDDESRQRQAAVVAATTPSVARRPPRTQARQTGGATPLQAGRPSAKQNTPCCSVA